MNPDPTRRAEALATAAINRRGALSRTDMMAVLLRLPEEKIGR